MLDDVETIEGCAEINAVQDHLCDERVVDACPLEDDGSVVEEVIGASQLLEHLKSHTERKTIAHLWSIQHSIPLLYSTASGCLGTKLLLDFFQFDMNGIMICRSAIDFHHRSFGFFHLSFSVIEARCLGEGQDADS